MVRGACDLASKNVDEAVKLENKGLIAQLVCLPLPLKSQWEFVSMPASVAGSSSPQSRGGSQARAHGFLGTGLFGRRGISPCVPLRPGSAGFNEAGRS